MQTLCERAEPGSEDRLFCLQQWIYDLTATEEGLLVVEPYWDEVSAVWPDSRSAHVVANQRALFGSPQQPAPYPEP
jgi:hypothetical protein